MKKLVLTLGAIAFAAAVVRFFLKGLLEPVGVPVFVGSFLASITIVLLVGVGLIFRREGHDPNGRFFRGAGWAVLLSLWCQILIIGGILSTEWLHADTYFSGPWQLVHERFPDDIVAALRDGKGLRIRAGTGPHRFIGIWVVVVE